MNKQILMCLFVSVLITACGEIGSPASRTACDRLEDAVVEAGVQGLDLAEFQAQAQGREELCEIAILQVQGSINTTKTAVAEKRDAAGEPPAESSTSRSRPDPVETVGPTTLPARIVSLLSASSQISLDGDAMEIYVSLTNENNEYIDPDFLPSVRLVLNISDSGGAPLFTEEYQRTNADAETWSSRISGEDIYGYVLTVPLDRIGKSSSRGNGLATISVESSDTGRSGNSIYFEPLDFDVTGLPEHSVTSSVATPDSELLLAPVPTPTAITASPANPTPAPTPEPAPTSVPTPTAISASSASPTPAPTPEPTPTQTPVPTATPIPHITTAPAIDTLVTLIQSADFIWEGGSPISVPLGEVGSDFTLLATVMSAHDNGRGIWSWGIDLTTKNGTESFFIRSNSSFGFANATSVTDITQYFFNVNPSQNSETKFKIDVWNGVTSVYINGSKAISFKGLWDEPGILSVGTNYPGTEIAQGFALISRDVVVKSTALVRGASFDIEVRSGQEKSLTISTDEFAQISAKFENPFFVSGEFLDFGVRVGLPWSDRQFEIKQSNSPDGISTYYLTVTHNTIGLTYWQKSVEAKDDEGHFFNFELNSADGTLRLTLDDVHVPLDGLQIDFDVEHLEDVEFFVNSDQRTIDSRDARFLSSPFVRITNFGLWND